ncbi:hypothetical protein scyTo_0009454 [Scyliorhinus torazame]|uniref:CNH domain-containing protein n=1 Tax=Scyliorhinus torazame TaxID=75743 RepID=A0A401NMD1_SCYTO|nr:hypothetical protein [Scyliorhinus torazame]
MLNRRSFSDVLPESPKSARKKEEARQAEFVRVGQALKLKTIVRGDAPTSLVTTGLYRKEDDLDEFSRSLVHFPASSTLDEGVKTFTWSKRRKNPWEPQCFCSNFPFEIICSDSWGQSLLISTDAGVLLLDEGQTPVPVFDRTLPVKQMDILETQDLLLTRADKGKDARLFVFRLSAVKKALEEKQPVKSKSDSKDNKLEKTKGCHLYAINTHHGAELRIVAAIRNKLLLITKKNLNRSNSFASLQTSAESPVEEFQYIREICLSDPPIVMTLVDGPTGENDNLICVAYRHQFDLVNESTGESYRLHHVDASKVKMHNSDRNLFNSKKKMVGVKISCNKLTEIALKYGGLSASVCVFPYILAFTTDSIEIRLVVNGNLVHTAVMLDLHLTASQSDIYFTSAAASVNAASSGSSKETSSHSSPQTPTGQELPVLPSSPGEGEIQWRYIYKIPLSNLIGRSIERPLKSPLVAKVITTPTSSGVAAMPVAHSLSLSRMEIKEIACRTRKELLGLTSESTTTKSDTAPKQKKWTRKGMDEEIRKGAVRSTSSDRILAEIIDTEVETQRHLSTSSDPDTAASRDESPPTSGSFQLNTSLDEEILDLK